MRNLQEIFDIAVGGIIAQGGPSVRPSKSRFGGSAVCLYRGNNDRKCAVGQLIADEDYDPAWEGIGISGSRPAGTGTGPDDIRKAAGITNDVQLRLARDLQRAHDLCGSYAGKEFFRCFIPKVVGIASLCGLDTAVVTNHPNYATWIEQ